MAASRCCLTSPDQWPVLHRAKHPDQLLEDTDLHFLQVSPRQLKCFYCFGPSTGLRSGKVKSKQINHLHNQFLFCSFCNFFIFRRCPILPSLGLTNFSPGQPAGGYTSALRVTYQCKNTTHSPGRPPALASEPPTSARTGYCSSPPYQEHHQLWLQSPLPVIQDWVKVILKTDRLPL